MSGHLLAAVMAIGTACVCAAATTETFTGSTYTTVSNYSSCTTGSCGSFTIAMKMSGTFTTSTALGGQLTEADLTSFSFSDGLTTYASTDANVRIYGIYITTDASGNVSAYDVSLQRWQAAGTSHASGSRLDYMVVSANGGSAHHNVPCHDVVSDYCNVTGNDDALSSASTSSGGSWVLDAGVPALGECGAICLTSLLILYAWYRFRRSEPGTTAA